MIKFFRRNQQAFILFIFIYCIITVVSAQAYSHVSDIAAVPFRLPFIANSIQNYLFHSNSKIVEAILSITGLLLISFYLVKVLISNLIVQQRSQFASLFVISISSFTLHQEIFSGAIPASFFLLLAIERVFGSSEKSGVSLRYLDAGILITVASLFYFSVIFFIPFFWISQKILRQFNWKEFLYTLIGLSLPFLYIFSAYFMFDRSIKDYLIFLKEWLTLIKVTDYSLPLVTGLAFYSFVVIIASWFALRKYSTTKVQVRKRYQLLLFLFLFAMGIYIFVPSAGIEMFFILSIPSSVVLSIYFSECKNTFFNRFLFFLCLLAPFFVNLFAAQF